jgi:hypothetical protein
MFVIVLRFSGDKAKAGRLMQAHNDWIRRGFEEGVGGTIVAHGSSLQDLQTRVNADPFVAEGLVQAEILRVAPSRCDERLNFLLGRNEAA